MYRGQQTRKKACSQNEDEKDRKTLDQCASHSAVNCKNQSKLIKIEPKSIRMFAMAYFCPCRSYCKEIIFVILGRFCKPNPVRFSERSASTFWPGRVKVHTNMCEPKVCSANRKLIFGLIFDSASSDGEATRDVQEDFGGSPVALESQSDKVTLARKIVFFFYLGLLCKAVRAGLVIDEAAAELFYTRSRRKRMVYGKGSEEKEDYL